MSDNKPLRRGVSGVCTRSICECERDGLGDQCVWLKPAVAEFECLGEPSLCANPRGCACVPDSKTPNAELTGLGRSPAESTEEGTPAKVRLTDVLGPLPERDARWALAAEVARGRMAGGWVPVDADLVLALHARLTKLAALEQQVAEGEELDKYRRGDGKREWSDACTWLYPGDRVVVLRA